MDEKQTPCEPQMRMLSESEVETALRAAAVSRAEADAALEAQGLNFRVRRVRTEAEVLRS